MTKIISLAFMIILAFESANAGSPAIERVGGQLDAIINDFNAGTLNDNIHKYNNNPQTEFDKFPIIYANAMAEAEKLNYELIIATYKIMKLEMIDLVDMARAQQNLAESQKYQDLVKSYAPSADKIFDKSTKEVQNLNLSNEEEKAVINNFLREMEETPSGARARAPAFQAVADRYHELYRFRTSMKGSMIIDTDGFYTFSDKSEEARVAELSISLSKALDEVRKLVEGGK